MKILRFNVFMLFMAVAGMSLMTACSDDDDGDDPQPEPNKPSLQFIGSGDFTADDATVDSGETVKFSWVAESGDNELKEVRITGGQNGGTVFDSTNLSDNNANSYQDEIAIVMTEIGEHTYTFEVLDQNDLKTSKSITITVNQNAKLNSYDQRLMGAQNNGQYGSFYATSQDSVYFASNFEEKNDIYIDFIYYYGSNNEATIAAPADPTMSDFTNTYGADEWDDRNETKYLKVSESFSSFDSEGDLQQYRSQLASSSKTKANQLSSNNVYAFLTEKGKIGALTVNNIDSQQGGFIDISVKVEP